MCASGSTREGSDHGVVSQKYDDDNATARSIGEARDCEVSVCSPLCVRARKMGCGATDVIRDAKLEVLDSAVSPFVDNAQCNDAAQSFFVTTSDAGPSSSSHSTHPRPTRTDGVWVDSQSADLHDSTTEATTIARGQIPSETLFGSVDASSSAPVSLFIPSASGTTEANDASGQPPHSPVLTPTEASSPRVGYLRGGGNPFAALLRDDDDEEEDSDNANDDKDDD